MRESRRIAILGCTGSVGRNTLAVVRHLGESHRVVALAAGRNAGLLMEQIREFRPALAALDDPGAAAEIRETAGRLGTRVLCGVDGATAVASRSDAELVVSAIVGSAGLVPTHAAVAAGRTVALANKEVLVVGGAAVRAAARASGAELLPVDSEHNALHQCLRAGRRDEVKRLVLTASGGPFWDRDGSTFDAITVKEALAHPVWNMGPKITVDSATLMNKGLEVIEARWLFDLPPSRVEIVVHPGSVVHSLVEFTDGSVLAQLGVADMRQPIQYALTWPERRPTPVPRLDLTALPPLRFYRPDPDRFPCPSLAYRALTLGAVAPAALNGANEALVKAFLDGEIRFTDIPRRLSRVLDEVAAGQAPGTGSETPTLETCLAADRWARGRALTPVPVSPSGDRVR
jgi:1-deoxy-D-xylulose-5-phosphate reductoisomerase